MNVGPCPFNICCTSLLKCSVCSLAAGFSGKGSEPHAAQPQSRLHWVQMGLTGQDTGERQTLTGVEFGWETCIVDCDWNIRYERRRKYSLKGDILCVCVCMCVCVTLWVFPNYNNFILSGCVCVHVWKAYCIVLWVITKPDTYMSPTVLNKRIKTSQQTK